jgi:hypothetical protein
MEHALGITRDIIVVPYDAIEFAWRICGDYPQAPPLALDFDGKPCFEHLVQQLVDVLP